MEIGNEKKGLKVEDLELKTERIVKNSKITKEIRVVKKKNRY